MPRELQSLSCSLCCQIEKGYGNNSHITDEEYRSTGAAVVSREEVLQNDIIVDVKLGDASYLDQLAPGKLLFGWAHAAQKTEFTTKCIQARHTVIAWEEMDEGSRNIFYRNRELAGEAAVLQSLSYTGKAPYDIKAAVLGRGNTAKGALRILHGLGATVDVYGSKSETLFLQKIKEYDMLVICVMWDIHRTKRLLNREDLAKLKPGTLLVDVSCDGDLAIETGRPTTIDDPTYIVDGIIHYVVDNTPALFHQTATNIISHQISPYLDLLARGETSPLLEKATMVKEGKILDSKILDYRKHLGLTIL